MFFYYINTNKTPNNFTFDKKDAIYYVTMQLWYVIFTWEDIMFFMVWYFIVVYMYMTKENISWLTLWKRRVKSFLESHLEGLAALEERFYQFKINHRWYSCFIGKSSSCTKEILFQECSKLLLSRICEFHLLQIYCILGSWYKVNARCSNICS